MKAAAMQPKANPVSRVTTAVVIACCFPFRSYRKCVNTHSDENSLFYFCEQRLIVLNNVERILG